MDLIIINGPIASGKTLIAKRFNEISRTNTALLQDCTIESAKLIIYSKKYETIIIDDSKNFKKKVIDYLKKHADMVKIITIEIL